MDSEWGSLCSLPTKPSKISDEMKHEIRNNEKYLRQGDNAKFKAKVSAAVTKAFDAATIGKNEDEFQKICRIIVKYTTDGDKSPRESLVAVIQNINIPKIAEFVLNNLEVLKDLHPGVKAYGYLCQMTTEILKNLRTTLSSSDDEATSSSPAFASGKGKKKPSESKSCLDSDDGLGSDSDDGSKKHKPTHSSGFASGSGKGKKKHSKSSLDSDDSLGSDSDDGSKKPQKKYKPTHSSGFASGSGKGGSSILSSIGASIDIFASKSAKEEGSRFSILDDDADCFSFKSAAKSSKKNHLSTSDWDDEGSSALVPQAKNSTMVSAKQVTSMFRKMQEAVQTQIKETCAEQIEQNNKKLASVFDRSMHNAAATLGGIRDEIFARLPAPATTPAASGGGGAKSTSLKDTVMPGFTKPLGQLNFSDFFTPAQIDKVKAKYPDKEECKRFLLHNYSNYIKGVDAESRRSVFVIWKQLKYPDVGPNPKKGASGSGKAPAPAPTGKTPEEVRADLEARTKGLAKHAPKENAGGEAGAAGLEDDAGHGKKPEDGDGKSEDSDDNPAESDEGEGLDGAGAGDSLDDPEKKE